jgi:hypothetical protein
MMVVLVKNCFFRSAAVLLLINLQVSIISPRFDKTARTTNSANAAIAAFSYLICTFLSRAGKVRYELCIRTEMQGFVSDIGIHFIT